MTRPTSMLYTLALLATPVGWIMAAGYRAAKTLRDMRYKPKHKESK